MKAYPITWKSQDFYDDHIVIIGSFHLICACLKMVSKKMNESGLADVLLEVGVISVGFINGVISDKNFSHAINCHKVMAKSMKRLLLDRYLETRCLKGLPSDLLQAIDRINHIMRELQKTCMLQCKTKHLLIFLKNIFRSGSRSVVEAKVKLPNLGWRS